MSRSLLLFPALAFFFGTFSFVHAATIRQPVDVDSQLYTVQGPTIRFKAPFDASIYSAGFSVSSNKPGTVVYVELFNDDFTNETHPTVYPIGISTLKQNYAVDFSPNPFPIVSGNWYKLVYHFGSSDPSATMTAYGSAATTTVYVGSISTTSAFCVGPYCGSLQQPYFFLSTTPLNLDIPKLYPSATSSALDLSTAQSFCGSSTYATSTGFWDSAGQAFSRGICLAFAAVFVPSSDSVGQFSALEPQLQAKIPFSYFYQTYTTLSGLQASTTENLPTLIIDLSSVDLGSSTPLGNLYSPQITILSTSTISHYMSDNTRHLWLAFLSTALWFMLVMRLYHKVVAGEFDVQDKYIP